MKIPLGAFDVIRRNILLQEKEDGGAAGGSPAGTRVKRNKGSRSVETSGSERHLGRRRAGKKEDAGDVPCEPSAATRS